MAGVAASAAEMISQLEAARKLALGDPQVYGQVLPGILPIIGPNAHIEVQRWGAEFLAEAFATPSLSNGQKEQASSEALPVLRVMLETLQEDVEVIKCAVQAAASLYPLVFRRVYVESRQDFVPGGIVRALCGCVPSDLFSDKLGSVSHPNDAALWQDMSSIKQNILKRMDTAPVAVRLNCIKFVQKVVQVETPGVISDPRRPDQNETSIALVPRTHPFLQLPNLEAEASGLLDRLLGVFQDTSMDPILVDATLNCLAILIRTRQSISTKIVSAILNFNPLKQPDTPMTARQMVVLRSMERTTRALLRWTLRIVPNHPLEQKIQAYLMRLQQSRSTLFADTTAQKRPADVADGLDDAKRQKITGVKRRYPPMPPPPNSFAHLFTLTEDPSLQQFDVTLLPGDIVSAVTALFLQHLDSDSLEEAVDVIRARYSHLQKTSRPTPVPEVPLLGPTGIDDEDDYDPEFITTDHTIEATTEKALEELAQPAIELGPFELPKAPPLTGPQVEMLADQTLGHIFQMVGAVDRSGQGRAKQRLGLSRLAAASNDRDSWITILLRIATRASAGLDDIAMTTTGDRASNELIKPESTRESDVADRIRQMIFMYILDDFRARLSTAISWLTEEWYADKIRAKSHPEFSDLPNYSRWVNRLVDRLLPYLDAKDKNLLIRFLSEIPAINSEILDRVKTLARDPERINMCILAMQYLLMMRPPTRELVLDAVTSIWHDGDAQARSATGKVLAKWRPGSLDQSAMKNEDDHSGKFNTNGLKSPPNTQSDLADPRKRTARMPVAVADS